MVKSNSHEIWEFLQKRFHRCLNSTQKQFKSFLISLIPFSKADEATSKKIRTGSLLLLLHCVQEKCAGDIIKGRQTILPLCVGQEDFRQTEQLAWTTNNDHSLSMRHMQIIIKKVQENFHDVQSLTLIIKQMRKLSVQCRRKSIVILAYQVCNHKKSDIIEHIAKHSFRFLPLPCLIT